MEYGGGRRTIPSIPLVSDHHLMSRVNRNNFLTCIQAIRSSLIPRLSSAPFLAAYVIFEPLSEKRFSYGG